MSSRPLSTPFIRQLAYDTTARPICQALFNKNRQLFLDIFTRDRCARLVESSKPSPGGRCRRSGGRGAAPGPSLSRPTPVRASPCHPLPVEGEAGPGGSNRARFFWWAGSPHPSEPLALPPSPEGKASSGGGFPQGRVEGPTSWTGCR